VTTPIASDPESIDAAWLTGVLRESGALPTGRVVDAHGKVIGTGKMGDNIRYELRYEGAPDTAPASVVAKLPAADPAARGAAAAQGAYRGEVKFYREIAPRVGMRTPHIHTAQVDDSGANFVILMEDLSPARPGDQIAGCSPDVAELALRELPKLQVPLVDAPVLEASDWIIKATPESAALGQAIFQQMWPGFVERFRSSLSDEGIALAERFGVGLVRWSAGYSGPKTLVHGDYRVENTLLGNEDGGPPIAVVDWQTCASGSPLIDVAYFIGGGLLPDVRREHERALLEGYRQELACEGFELAASECWTWYRRAALHGILITVLGAMFTSPGERSDRMFSVMIERHLQHAIDLDSAEFLK
jgi:hypothetical protein